MRWAGAVFGVFLCLPALAAGPFGGTVNSLVMDSRSEALAWASTDRGLFRFEAGQWRRVEALGQEEILAVVETPARLVAARPRGGLAGSGDGGDTWQPLGEGLVGRLGTPVAEILCLVAHPQEPSTLYLGASRQGPFASRDGGRTWKLLLEGLEEEPAPAFHPRALLPDTAGRPLLMGTDGRGLYARQGGRWSPYGEGLPAGLRVEQLAAHPGNPEHVALASRNEGLWESRDGGRTWTQVRRGGFGLVAAAAIGWDGRILAHFTGEGLFLSGGESQSRPTDLDEAKVRSVVGRSGGGFFLGLEDDGVLEVGADGVPGAFRNQGLAATRIGALTRGTAPGALWAGDANGVFFSGDGGKTWDARHQGLDAVPAQTFLWLGGELYLGSGGRGVFAWDAAAGAWQPRSLGLGSANTIYSLGAAAGGGRLYAGTEGGVMTSGDGGASWARSGGNLPAFPRWLAAPSAARPALVWAAGGRSVYRSEDGGQSWSVEFEARPEAVSVSPWQGEEHLWLLEGREILRALGRELERIPLPLEAGERPLCLAPAGDDVFWIGTTRGLLRFDGWEARRVWTGPPVLSLLALAPDRLVLGTDGAGVLEVTVD